MAEISFSKTPSDKTRIEVGTAKWRYPFDISYADLADPSRGEASYWISLQLDEVGYPYLAGWRADIFLGSRTGSGRYDQTESSCECLPDIGKAPLVGNIPEMSKLALSWAFELVRVRFGEGDFVHWTTLADGSALAQLGGPAGLVTLHVVFDGSRWLGSVYINYGQQTRWKSYLPVLTHQDPQLLQRMVEAMWLNFATFMYKELTLVDTLVSKIPDPYAVGVDTPTSSE